MKTLNLKKGITISCNSCNSTQKQNWFLFLCADLWMGLSFGSGYIAVTRSCTSPCMFLWETIDHMGHGNFFSWKEFTSRKLTHSPLWCRYTYKRSLSVSWLLVKQCVGHSSAGCVGQKEGVREGRSFAFNWRSSGPERGCGDEHHDDGQVGQREGCSFCFRLEIYSAKERERERWWRLRRTVGRRSGAVTALDRLHLSVPYDSPVSSLFFFSSLRNTSASSALSRGH